jgi:hypothetical protein
VIAAALRLMEIKVKPIFILGSLDDRQNNADEIKAGGVLALRGAELSRGLRNNLKHRDTLLEDTLILKENDLIE